MKCPQLQGPSTLFSRLLAHLDERRIGQPHAPFLRYYNTGAGPLGMPLKRQVEARFGQPLHHGHGLSEYAGSVHVTPLGQHCDDTAAGARVDGAELRIVGADGRDRPAGERGELWLRGRGLMAGYFLNDAATAAVMRQPGGWYASGDIGHLDAARAHQGGGRVSDDLARQGDQARAAGHAVGAASGRAGQFTRSRYRPTTPLRVLPRRASTTCVPAARFTGTEMAWPGLSIQTFA